MQNITVFGEFIFIGAPNQSFATSAILLSLAVSPQSFSLKGNHSVSHADTFWFQGSWENNGILLSEKKKSIFTVSEVWDVGLRLELPEKNPGPPQWPYQF